MSKKEKNEVVETTAKVVAENEEVVEEKVTLGTKIVTGVKKHGKKILTGIGLIAAVGIGYALGNKSDDSDDYDFSYEPDVDDVVDAFTDFDAQETNEEV